jgi:Ca-activated chloride channel family protein
MSRSQLHEAKWFPYAVATIAGLLLIGGVHLFFRNGPLCAHPVNPVKLEINSSTEKADLLESLAKEYTEAGHQVGGRCTVVTVDGLTSGLAMKALEAQALRASQDNRKPTEDDWKPTEADGKTPILKAPKSPQVWTPSSSIWFEMLKDGKAGGVFRSSSVRPIASSPMVVAMPQAMGKVLQPENLSLEDILDLKGTWKDYGHPEWDKFTYVKDDPALSTSGLMGTIATYNSVIKPPHGLTENQVEKDFKAQKIIRDIEASVSLYGEDLTYLLGTLKTRENSTEGGGQVSAVVTQESLAYQFNEGRLPDHSGPEGAKIKKAEVPLMALYPSDGTLNFDHPYIVLPNATPEQRELADDFSTYLMQAPQRQRFAKEGFRSVDEKTPPENVLTSLGNPNARELKYLNLPGPAVVKRIIGQSVSLHKPANILFVMDTSGSMGWNFGATSEKRSHAAAEATITGLKTLNPRDRVGLWSFSTEDPERHPRTPYAQVIPLRALDKDYFAAKLGDITRAPTGGYTALYRTVRAAQAYMLKNWDPTRIIAIVVLTDGLNDDKGDSGKSKGEKDTANAEKLRTLLADLRAAPFKGPRYPGEPREKIVRIFGIGFDLSPTDEGFGPLQQISDETGVPATSAKDRSKIGTDFVRLFNNF